MTNSDKDKIEKYIKLEEGEIFYEGDTLQKEIDYMARKIVEDGVEKYKKENHEE